MQAKFLKSATRIEDVPSGKPIIAFVGRSNVGKSSILNSLANQKNLARVSAEPGRTQTLNVYDFDQRLVVDLPGYGYAKTSKEKRAVFEGLIYDFLCHTPNLKFVLAVIDARHGATDLDREMLAFLEQGPTPYAIVANKADKLKRAETAKLQREMADVFPNVPTILHSSVTGQGLGQLKDLLQGLRLKSESAKL